jgi:hypothetical protein
MAARIALGRGVKFFLAALVVPIAAIAAAFAYPAAAAIACPSCYGLEAVHAGIYIDRSASSEQRAQIVALIDQARERVRSLYGQIERSPRILICATSPCYHSLGGGESRGMALGNFGLLLSPRALTSPVIPAHELAHVELHSRIGLLRTYRRDIPQWFDEGLAVNVSDDPRYLAPGGVADRCLVSSDEPLPLERGSWVETARTRDLYAKAACRVSRWMAANGGPEAVLSLIARISGGEKFGALVQ